MFSENLDKIDAQFFLQNKEYMRPWIMTVYKVKQIYVHQFTLLQIIWEEESLHITSPSPWFSNPMNNRMKSVKISETCFQSWLLRSFLNKITPVSNREEKSLRRVAMVAKFLDDNKPKIDLKREFALFKLLNKLMLSF